MSFPSRLPRVISRNTAAQHIAQYMVKHPKGWARIRSAIMCGVTTHPDTLFCVTMGSDNVTLSCAEHVPAAYIVARLTRKYIASFTAKRNTKAGQQVILLLHEDKSVTLHRQTIAVPAAATECDATLGTECTAA